MCVCVCVNVWVAHAPLPRLPLHPIGVVAHPTEAHKWLLSYNTPHPPAVLTLQPRPGASLADMEVTLRHLPVSSVTLPETASESASQKRVTNNHCCSWGPAGSIIVATSLVRARVVVACGACLLACTWGRQCAWFALCFLVVGYGRFSLSMCGSRCYVLINCAVGFGPCRV